jgi:hypothetical protein
VLGLYYANTPEITIHEIPFREKVVVTSFCHVAKRLHLVLGRIGVTLEGPVVASVKIPAGNQRVILNQRRGKERSLDREVKKNLLR